MKFKIVTEKDKKIKGKLNIDIFDEENKNILLKIAEYYKAIEKEFIRTGEPSHEEKYVEKFNNIHGLIFTKDEMIELKDFMDNLFNDYYNDLIQYEVNKGGEAINLKALGLG